MPKKTVQYKSDHLGRTIEVPRVGKSPETISNLKRDLLMKRIIVRGFALRKITNSSMTPVYAFLYRSATATDTYPIILLIDAKDSLDGARFRYGAWQKSSFRSLHTGRFKKPRKSQAKGDTYIAGIRLDTLGPVTLMNLLERFSNRKSISLNEAKTLQMFTKQGYRVYDTRKIREFAYIDTSDALEVVFAPWARSAAQAARRATGRIGKR